MAVRSDRLFGPVVLPDGGFAALCEVPIGQVWLLKSLRVVAISGDSCTFDLRTDADDIGTSMFCGTSLGSFGIVTDSTWQVLDTGDALFGRASLPAAAVIWASGAKLVVI